MQLSSDTLINPVCFDECEACKGVGIGENEKNILFSIFPNPAGTNLSIYSDLSSECIYRLLDHTGKQVLEGRLLQASTINISELPNGFYMLEISNQQKRGFQKLIVAR